MRYCDGGESFPFGPLGCRWVTAAAIAFLRELLKGRPEDTQSASHILSNAWLRAMSTNPDRALAVIQIVQPLKRLKCRHAGIHRKVKPPKCASILGVFSPVPGKFISITISGCVRHQTRYQEACQTTKAGGPHARTSNKHHSSSSSTLRENSSRKILPEQSRVIRLSLGNEADDFDRRRHTIRRLEAHMR